MMPHDGMHSRPPLPIMHGGGPPMGNQFPVEQSLLYKTRICKDWRENKCRFGSSCKYAHGEHELRQLTPEATALQQQIHASKQAAAGSSAGPPHPPPRPPGDAPKRPFPGPAGGWGHGDRSRFAHDPSLLGAGPRPPQMGALIGPNGPIGGPQVPGAQGMGHTGPGLGPGTQGMPMQGGDGFTPGHQGGPSHGVGAQGMGPGAARPGMPQHMQQQAQQQGQQGMGPQARQQPPPPTGQPGAGPAGAGAGAQRPGMQHPAGAQQRAGPGAGGAAAAPGPVKVEVTYVDRVRAVCGMLSIGNAAAISKEKPAALPLVVGTIKSGAMFRENPYADSVEQYLSQQQ